MPDRETKRRQSHIQKRRQSIVTKSKSKRSNTLFLCFCACTYAFYIGPIFLLGLFFIEFQYHLNATPSEASLAIALPPAMEFLGGPLYSIIFNALGYKRSFLLALVIECLAFLALSFASSILLAQLCLAVVGVGVGLSSLSMYSAVGMAFGKKRSFANSIISTSGVVTAFFLGPLTQYLVEKYTWRGATLILCGVVMNGIPSVMLASRFYIEDAILITEDVTVSQKLHEAMEKDEEKCRKEEIKQKELSWLWRTIYYLDLRLLCDVFYLLYTLGMAFTTLGLVSISLYLVRYAQDVGIDSNAAVWLLSISRLLFMITCPLVGMASSYCSGCYDETITDNNTPSFQRLCAKIRRAHLLAFIQLFFAFSIVFPTFNETFLQFVFFSILVGIASGATGALPITVLADMFGTDRLSSALGFRAMVTGTFVIVSPPLIGRVIEQVNSYRPAQYISGTCVGAAALLNIISQWGLKMRHDRKNRKKDASTVSL